MGEFDAFYSGNRVPDDFQERILAMLSEQTYRKLIEIAQQGQCCGTISTTHPPDLIVSTLAYTLKTQSQQLAMRHQAMLELLPNQNQCLLTVLIDLLIKGLAPNKPHRN
jgi:hypothetical protein